MVSGEFMAEDDLNPAPSGENEEIFDAGAAPATRHRQLESSYYSVVSRTTADGKVLINQDTEIFTDSPCPEYANALLGTQAYDAKDTRQTATEQFALLCDWRAMPRVMHIGSYKSVKSPNLMALYDAGIVNWPLEGRQKFGFIFEKPMGKKLIGSPDGPPYRIAEDKIIPLLVEPLLRLLVEFRNVELVHRAINMENIYMTGAEGSERVILGECLSTAPSLRQNPIYETISRAPAQASGRGRGTIADDLYALGVCVAMVARGQNLLAGKTPQEIIHDKIEHGSHITIIGKERIPGGLAEFLRGVLNDDTDQRWGLDDAIEWLDGQRHSPKQARVVMKAARPFPFHGQKFWDLRSLAQVFSENVSEAATEIEKDQFYNWVKRNFDDKGLYARFERLWENEKEAARERLVACVCMAMDPLGPVRYKELSVFPDGLGMALSCTVARNADAHTYGELIQSQLFNLWVNQSFDNAIDSAGVLAMLEKCRSSVSQRLSGMGLERVLYMLNSEAPCMSPMFKNHFVLSAKGVLLALNDIAAGQGGRNDNVLDRHIAAFISVREPKMIDPYLGYINSRNRGQQVIGVIRSLAAVQRRFAVPPVPALCKWLISLTGPIIELYNDNELKQEITHKISSMPDNGNLTILLDAIDDYSLVRKDAQRFAFARQEYAALVAEKYQIEKQLANRQIFGGATGRQASMLVSCALGAVVIAGYLVLRFMGKL